MLKTIQYLIVLQAFSSSPFDLPVSDIAESYSVTLGSSYKLIQEIQKLGDTPYHVILVGSIYGISLPRHNIYKHPDDNSPMLFKPVAYSLAKAAQILLLKEAVGVLALSKNDLI